MARLVDALPSQVNSSPCGSYFPTPGNGLNARPMSKSMLFFGAALKSGDEHANS